MRSRKRAVEARDGGVDLVLKKDGEKFLVQCKQWKTYKVGVTILRELFGVMAAEGATGGFVVTSGNFTQEAMDFSEGKNIELIDGVALASMIKNIQPISALNEAKLKREVPLRETSDPTCPNCGSRMVRRAARQGANAGRDFWGLQQLSKVSRNFADCLKLQTLTRPCTARY